MEKRKLKITELCHLFLVFQFIVIVFGNFSTDIIENVNNYSVADYYEVNLTLTNLQNDTEKSKEFSTDIIENVDNYSVADNYEVNLTLTNLQNDTETSKEFFTEKLLTQRAGRRINLKKLLEEYALICPLQDTCGIEIDKKFFSNGSIGKINPECKVCSCDTGCLTYMNRNCCPASHLGYFDLECINTTLFLDPSYFNSHGGSYFMVTKCLDEYHENTTMIELCASTVSPCTSDTSGLVFKNKYCAICNEELQSECIPWSIKTECDSPNSYHKGFQEILSSVTSLTEMHNTLKQYNCEIYFKPPPHSANIFSSTAECGDYNPKSRTYVNRCNITGLWELYDADIKWACENLLLPYKEFKNVFCYICNPSIANIQNISLIDNCRGATNLTHNNIHKACESLPTSARLKPFKNIFCYACNQDSKFLYTTSDYGFVNVSETNNLLKYGTELSFYILVRGQNTTLSMKRFLVDTFNETFQHGDVGGMFNTKAEVVKNVKELDKLRDSYISVCGIKTVCNASPNQTNRTYGNPVCGRCSCGGLCVENENCCPDLIFQEEPYSCFDPQGLPSLQKTSVFKRGMTNYQLLPSYVPGTSYKVIDKCQVKYINTVWAEKCSSFGEQADILTSIPVTMFSGISYKNVYCYVCNNNISDIYVGFQVLCDAYIEHELFTSTFQLLDAVNHFCNKVFFVPSESRNCKKKYDDSKAGLRGGEEYVRDRHAKPGTKDIRWIYVFEKDINEIENFKSVYSTCNQTGHLKDKDKLLNHVCEDEDENILSLPEYRVENSVYKNFACFLCNPDVSLTEVDFSSITSNCLLNTSVEWHVHNEDLEELCSVTEFHPRWFPFKNMYCSECNLPPWQLVDFRIDILRGEAGHGGRYRYIFSLSRDDFERMVLKPNPGKIPQCSSGTFDHSMKQCSFLYCNGGFQLFNNTCLPVLNSASDLQYQIDFKLRHLSRKPKNISTKVEGKTSIIIDLDELCSRVLDIITEPFQDTTLYTSDKKCRPAKYGFRAHQGTMYDTVSSNTESFFDITSIGPIHVHVDIRITYTEKIALVQTSLVKAQDNTYEIRNFSDIQGIAWSFNFISESNRDKFNVFSDISPRPVTPWTILVDRFYICPHVKFNLSETSLNLETGDIYIKERNLTFAFHEYVLSEQNVAICYEDFNRKNKKTQSIQKVTCTGTVTVESIFYVFDLVCSIVSMACLLLTIVTYSLFSSLRTIPGQSIMALCVFLFCSQGLLQFGLDVSEEKLLCKIIGIVIHYSWLASFCAMNVCSFHTFKMFVFKDTLNRPSGRFLFVKYLIYIISLPLVGVLISVLVNLTTGSNLGYGENVCFISDFYVFVGTFLIPSCVIFVSNIIFFATAFHKIRTTKRVQSTHERNNFYICLKLCAIVGVTWPLLIIDNVAQLAWFSFVASGVNALQGVFIFISFVFNSKVKTLYSTFFRKHAARIRVTRNTTDTNVAELS